MPWEEEEGDETFTSPLPQEDRIWRHPAEVAAAQRARAPITTTTTMRTPWRQALGLAGIGAAGGALVVAGLFWSLGTTNGGAGPVTQAMALDPIVPVPIEVDLDEWPAKVADTAGHGIARIVVTKDTHVHDGSAVAFRSDGLLLTSHDLVSTADQIRVTLADGSRHVGVVVGSDEISGVAVVQIDEMDIAPAHLGIVKPAPEVGQYTAIVTGTAAHNMPQRTTITALSTQVATDADPLHGMIQLGTALPADGDGAAIVDGSGAVIGIALDVGTTNATYAVPIGFARKIAGDLVSHGEPRLPWMGIKGVDVATDTQIAHKLTGGVQVTVVLDGPAAEAGIERGDVIMEVDEEPIESMTELIQLLRTKPPGKTLAIEYIRDNEHRSCDVTLALRPIDDGA